MCAGMTKDTLVEILKQYFSQHAKQFGVTMAFLYGSWAHNMQGMLSDIDIAVLLEETDTDKQFAIINAITLALCDLLHTEVNVLYIDNELSKPMLHYNAIVKGEVVYFNDFTNYVDMYLKALAQMEDFSLFGIQWQKQVIEKNIKDLHNA